MPQSGDSESGCCRSGPNMLDRRNPIHKFQGEHMIQYDVDGDEAMVLEGAKSSSWTQCKTNSRTRIDGTKTGVVIALRRMVERMRIPHEKMEGLSVIGIDCGFFGHVREDVLPILCVKCRNSSTGCMGTTVVDRKGALNYASSILTAIINSLGFKRVLVRPDNGRSLLNLIEPFFWRAMCQVGADDVSRIGSSSKRLCRVGVREIKAQTRILRSQLEQWLGSQIDEKDPLSWIPRHAANCVSRYRIMDDGRTQNKRWCGKISSTGGIWWVSTLQTSRWEHCIARWRPEVCWAVSMWGVTRDLVLWFSSRQTTREEKKFREWWNTRDGIACSVQRVLEFLGNRDQINGIWWDSLYRKRRQNKVLRLWSWCLQFRKLIGEHMSRREILWSTDTQTNARHARSWCQACTMQRFFMTTDAETALVSSWQNVFFFFGEMMEWESHVTTCHAPLATSHPHNLRGADPAQPHGHGAWDRPPHVRRGDPTGKLQRPMQLHRRHACSIRRLIRSGSDLVRASASNCTKVRPTAPHFQSQNHRRAASWLHEFRVW